MNKLILFVLLLIGVFSFIPIKAQPSIFIPMETWELIEDETLVKKVNPPIFFMWEDFKITTFLEREEGNKSISEDRFEISYDLKSQMYVFEKEDVTLYLWEESQVWYLQIRTENSIREYCLL